jgi:pimeloyl-ACP methyl ester carboxylesterase
MSIGVWRAPSDPWETCLTASAASIGGSTVAQNATVVGVSADNLPPYGNSTLAPGVRSRIVNNINGLAIHMLEAGFETNGRPLILLLHGFPELAYSWRKIMGPLSAAGYHVVAPDQRGYGRTTGWDDAYDGDLASFRLANLVRDALGLVSALGYRSVAAVVGHDFGSPVAAYCTLIRPDVFRSVALMSAPFGGPPQLPFRTAEETTPSVAPDSQSVFEDLARLDPPRKHYQRYYQTREANDDMWKAPQGPDTCPFTQTNLLEPDFRAASIGIDALQANTSVSLRRFPAAPSMCRRVSSRAKAIGASIRFRAPLRGWRPLPVRNGRARISSMARDIGFSKNSPRRSVVCCCSS